MQHPDSSPAPADGSGAIRERNCRFGRMRYFSHDAYIGATLERYGEFSPDEAALLAALLEPGDVAIDAGANIGCLTMAMARKVGGQGCIHAFEPRPALFALLQANLALNRLDNVSAHRAALGERSGRQAIAPLDTRRPGNFGEAALRPAGHGDTVTVTTIDRLALSACRLIKADVQGMERALLLGARATIDRCRPLLYLENDLREHSRALLELLLGLGYRAYWHLPALAVADNFRGAPLDDAGNIVSVNLLCLPDDRPPPSPDLAEVTGVDDWWQSDDKGDGVRPSETELFAIARRQFGRARFDEACALLDALLEFAPDQPDALMLLAECHHRAGRDGAAIACLQRLLARHGDEVDALCALADLLVDGKRFGEAVAAMSRAHHCDPSNAALLHGLAVMLRRDGRGKEALATLDRALALAPHFDIGRFERAMVLLEAGRLTEAWPDYDLRHLLDPAFEAPPTLPRWQGGRFDGQRLLVTAEGGHGDTIWAARFLPALRALGGEVHLQVRPEQRELLAALDGVDGFVPLDAGEDGFDLYCPLLSLPARLDVSDPSAYPPARLNPSPSPPEHWSRLLARADGRLRVGMLWSGNETYANNRHRAAALSDFLPLLEVPSVQLYSLQKGMQQAVLREAGLGSLIIDTDDCDFSETAALVAGLDLVVMTDTALAHIAASMGKPVWLLLDSAPFWLYGASGETCPWYPSMKLFRQTSAGDWAGVIGRVRTELARLDRGA